MDKLVNVGIADIQCTNEANAVFRTILGSCVGICLYDRERKIAGMAHIMLPTQKDSESNFMKYADKAIPHLIASMIKLGATQQRLSAKIAGGASMFETSANSFMAEIGRSNIQMVKNILDYNNIPIIAEDTGGKKGRTIDLYVADGRLRIKTFGFPEKFI